MTSQISLRRFLSHGLSSNLRTASSVAHGYHARRNASATAGTLTHKGPVTAKTTAKAAHVPGPSATRKGASSNTSRRKGTSPAMAAASSAAQTATTAQTEQNMAQEAVSSPTPGVAKKYADMTEEEKEREVQRLLTYSELMPTVDPFGQEIVDTLDVMIPYPTTWSPSKNNLHQMQSNTSNYFKNSAALSMLMSYDCIPGINLNAHKKSWTQNMIDSFKRFHVHSTQPDALIAPFRQIALEMYEELNRAVASRNERALRDLVTFTYQKQISELVKASLKNNPKGRLLWQLHRIIDPVQVVSIRTSQGYVGPTEPRFGNRLMIHALVKFDTEQSLEIYSARGQALHPPAPKDQPYAIADADKKLEKWRVPAERRRVTEYLVMEKKMWVQGPWSFREQMWPSSSEAAAVAPPAEVGVAAGAAS
ncbi:hypothetical protein CPB83DRAFT_865482 [Crepidotus variabilis]|uniref:Tim44-like domain-containing protein n=1 Tax=Crepidotus variabilis TaxID=179855 RepID=A0A9P6JHS7_9AGAR|nr:hypothetical protein CPB83DRAFT_865482 [Crepidotus variabilis]